MIEAEGKRIRSISVTERIGRIDSRSGINAKLMA
jgi:hypothetical protein